MKPAASPMMVMRMGECRAAHERENGGGACRSENAFHDTRPPLLPISVTSRSLGLEAARLLDEARDDIDAFAAVHVW